jgi:hypothetical protein
MGAVRWRKPRDKRSIGVQPIRQSALENAVAAAADARYNNDNTLTAPMRRAEKPCERRFTTRLSVAVQIKHAAHVDLAAPHAALVGAILRPRRLGGRRNRFRRWGKCFLGRLRRCWRFSFCVDRFSLGQRLRRLSNAAPEFRFLRREAPLLFGHAA